MRAPVNRTKIEWVAQLGYTRGMTRRGYTWNPIVGCTHGCRWCYARRQAKRQRQNCICCYEFTPHLHPERLDQPERMRTPAGIFVCSMGELFDPETADYESSYIMQGLLWARVVDAMLDAPQHRYYVLTKRPDLMVQRLRSWGGGPQDNWVLMTSVTNQADVEARVPEIMKLRADGWGTIGVSVEPMLGPVDLSGWVGGPTGRFRTHEGRRQFEVAPSMLGWVIVGAQTGPGARLPESTWVKQVIMDCRQARVPVFIKENVVWLDVIREWPD